MGFVVSVSGTEERMVAVECPQCGISETYILFTFNSKKGSKSEAVEGKRMKWIMFNNFVFPEGT